MEGERPAAAVEAVADRTLPAGYGFEWSDISFQEKRAEGQMAAILAMAVLFAYLFLVGLYESWTIPIPVLLSVAVGVLGMSAGIWAVARGARKRGFLAVGLGLAGIVLGILATRSTSSDLQIVFSASLIASMLVFATPLTFAAIGGMFSERSGVVIIGLEGMMLMGAFWAVYGADVTDSWVGGLLIGMLSGGLLAAVVMLGSATLLYLYVEVHSRLGDPSLAFARARDIFLLGLIEAAGLGLLVTSLLGPLMALRNWGPLPAAETLEGLRVALQPFLGELPRVMGVGPLWAFPSAVLLMSFLAFFIGTFLQLLWEDLPITEPL